MTKFLSLLKSRRFWAASVGVVAVVASEVFGVSLDTEQLLSIVSIVIAWIVGDTVRETV
jgi:uncharacterized membrane protein